MSDIFGYHLLFDAYITSENGNNEEIILEEYIKNVTEFLPKSKEILENLKNALHIYEMYRTTLKSEDRWSRTIIISKYYKNLYNIIGNLPKNKPTLLVSGYSSKSGGHSIMIEITPTNKYYDILLFNSGEGITKYHKNNDAGIITFKINKNDSAGLPNNGIYYLLAHIVWMNIAYGATIDYSNYLNIDTFYNRIIEIIETDVCAYYSSESSVSKDPSDYKSEYKFDVLAIKQPQMSGSCTFYSKLYWIEHALNRASLMSDFLQFNFFIESLKRKYINLMLKNIKDQSTINDYNMLYLIKLNYKDLMMKGKSDELTNLYFENVRKYKINIDLTTEEFKGLDEKTIVHFNEQQLFECKQLIDEYLTRKSASDNILKIITKFINITEHNYTNSFFILSTVVLFGILLRNIYEEKLIIKETDVDSLIYILKNLYIQVNTQPFEYYITNTFIKISLSLLLISFKYKYSHKYNNNNSPDLSDMHSISYFLDYISFVDAVLLFDQTLMLKAISLMYSMYGTVIGTYGIYYEPTLKCFQEENSNNIELIKYDERFKTIKNILNESNIPSIIKIFLMALYAPQGTDEKLNIYERNEKISIAVTNISYTRQPSSYINPLHSQLYSIVELVKYKKIKEINNYNNNWSDILIECIDQNYNTIKTKYFKLPKEHIKLLIDTSIDTEMIPAPIIKYNQDLINLTIKSMPKYIFPQDDLIEQLKTMLMQSDDIKKYRLDFLILYVSVKLLHKVEIENKSIFVNIVRDNVNSIYGELCSVILLILDDVFDDKLFSLVYSLQMKKNNWFIKCMFLFYMIEKYDYKIMPYVLNIIEMNIEMFRSKYPKLIIDSSNCFVMNKISYQLAPINMQITFKNAYVSYYEIKNPNNIIVELKSAKLKVLQYQNTIELVHYTNKEYKLITQTTNIPIALLNFYDIYENTKGSLNLDMYNKYLIYKSNNNFMMQIIHDNINDATDIIFDGTFLYIDGMKLYNPPLIMINKWANGMKNCYIVESNNEYKLLIKNVNLIIRDKVWTGSDTKEYDNFEKEKVDTKLKYYVLDIHKYGLTLNGDLNALKAYLKILILNSNFEILYILMNKYKMYMYDLEIKLLFKSTNNPFHYYFASKMHNNMEEFELKSIKKYIEGTIKRRENYYPPKFFDEKEIDWQENNNGYEFIDIIKASKFISNILIKYLTVSKIQDPNLEYNEIDTCELKNNIDKKELKDIIKILKTQTLINLQQLDIIHINFLNNRKDKWDKTILNASIIIYESMYLDTLLLTYKEIKITNKMNKISNCKELIDYYNRINIDNYETYEPRTNFYTMFELLFGKFIKKSQMNIIHKIENNPTAIFQLLMGRGKTTVIAPYLTLSQIHNNRNVIMLMPNHLLSQSLKIMSKYDLLLSNALLYDNLTSFIHINELSHVENNASIYMLNNMQIQHYLLNNVINKRSFILLDTTLVIDEIDNMLNPMTSELNIPLIKMNLPLEIKSMYEFLTEVLLKNQYLIENLQSFEVNHFVDKMIKEYREDINWKSYFDILEKKIIPQQNDIIQYYICDKIITTLQKCLKMKFKEKYDFGNEIKQSDKNHKIAIPLNAVDDPNDGSEFTDPDMAAILTILTYIYRKLTVNNVNEYISYLNKHMNDKEDFNQYIKDLYGDEIIQNGEKISEIILRLSKNEINHRSIRDIDNIKINSNLVKKFIMYILEKYIVININQYNSSFMDIINTKLCDKQCGFSGTVNFDLPKQEDVEQEDVKQEDVKIKKQVVIHMQHINKYIFNKIEEDKESQQNVKLATNFNDGNPLNNTGKFLYIENIDGVYKELTNNYDALIDVCAYFRIYTSEQIANNISIILKRSVIYWDTSDKAQIIKFNEINTNIFLYYDNKHIIGIDIDQRPIMKGLVLISETSKLTNTSQGMFRLRKLNMGHNVNFGVVDKSLIKIIEKQKYDLYNILRLREEEQKINTRPKFLIQNIKTNNRIRSVNDYNLYKNDVFYLFNRVIKTKKIEIINEKPIDANYFYTKYLEEMLKSNNNILLQNLLKIVEKKLIVLDDVQLQVEKEEEKEVEKAVAVNVENALQQVNRHGDKIIGNNVIYIKDYISNDYSVFSNYDSGLINEDNYLRQLIDLLKDYKIFISTYWFMYIGQYAGSSRMENEKRLFFLDKYDEYAIKYGRDIEQLELIDGFILTNSKEEYLIIGPEEFGIIHPYILKEGKENNIQYGTKYGKIINTHQIKKEMIVRLILCGIYNISYLEQFYRIFLKTPEHNDLIKKLVPLLNLLYNALIPFSHLVENIGNKITMTDLNTYQEFRQTSTQKKEKFIDIVNNQSGKFPEKILQGGNRNRNYFKYLGLRKKYDKLKYNLEY